MLLTAPCLAEDVYIKSPGKYGEFYRYVQSNVRHWNPGMTDEEIRKYTTSTWNGCMGNLSDAKEYFYVCLKEQGCRNRDLFDKGGGYGYSGANSKVVKRANYGRSRKWTRAHPYTTNENIAWYFSHVLKSNPLWWYSNKDQGKMQDYEDDIDSIRDYCEEHSGQSQYLADEAGKN